MQNFKMCILICSVFLVVSCEKIPWNTSTSPPQALAKTDEQKIIFQLITSNEGKLYRLNSSTGEIFVVTDTGLTELTSETTVLQIGQYYKMADGKTEAKFLKYLGDGKFEPSRFAIKEIK